MKKPAFPILLSVLGLVLTGCSTSLQTPEASPTKPVLEVLPSTETPLIEPSDIIEFTTTTAVEDPTPTIEAVTLTPVEIPEIPDQPLSLNGPWWTFSTTAGLFAVNPDGSGLTPFHDGPISYHLARQTIISPHNNYVAYIIGEGIEATLVIRQLPWLMRIIEKPLLSYGKDIELDALRAVTEYQSLAFSPDGQMLAFVGTIDGPTSDLYVFSLETFQMMRLSDGPSQAYQPSWSPDSKNIVFIGARTFGSGAGSTLTKVWATRADGSEIVGLYEPLQSGGETIIGWVDNQTFLVHSWSPVCGKENLRTVNIMTKEINVLWSESFQATAYDPMNNVALVSSHKGTCSPAQGTGYYWIPIDSGGSVRVLEFQDSQMIWSPDVEKFLATSNFEWGVLAFDLWGQYIDLDMPWGARDFPSAAPGTWDLAWPGDALWIGSFLGSIDFPPVKIFEEPVAAVTWTSDGESVIFLAESGLYLASKPDFTPILIEEGLGAWSGFSGWVRP